jgi:acetylornithine/succinyldiaminopimelate/putrescine aminotransferase
LSCAAALAALDIISDSGFLAQVKIRGDQLTEQLCTIHAVKEVRGRGLMLAVELKQPETLHDTVRACREEGLLVDWFLFNDRSLRLYPPLVINETESGLLGLLMKRALGNQ